MVFVMQLFWIIHQRFIRDTDIRRPCCVFNRWTFTRVVLGKETDRFSAKMMTTIPKIINSFAMLDNFINFSFFSEIYHWEKKEPEKVPRNIPFARAASKNFSVTSEQVDIVGSIGLILLIVGLILAAWCFLNSVSLLTLSKSQDFIA